MRGSSHITLLGDIESVFIRRPEAPAKDAVLSARIKGKHAPITILQGDLDDIEAAHHALCEASTVETSCAQSNPS